MSGAVLTNAVVKFAVLTAAICAFARLSWAQDVGGKVSVDTLANISVNNDVSADTSAGALGNNDVLADTVAAPASHSAQISHDSLDDTDDIDDDELILADIVADSTKPQVQKPNLIRREYDYKRQTRLAIVMMAFIAVLMGTSQSFNPR
jgi:hypothetical protein